MIPSIEQLHAKRRERQQDVSPVQTVELQIPSPHHPTEEPLDVPPGVPIEVAAPSHEAHHAVDASKHTELAPLAEHVQTEHRITPGVPIIEGSIVSLKKPGSGRVGDSSTWLSLLKDEIEKGARAKEDVADYAIQEVA